MVGCDLSLPPRSDLGSSVCVGITPKAIKFIFDTCVYSCSDSTTTVNDLLKPRTLCCERGGQVESARSWCRSQQEALIATVQCHLPYRSRYSIAVPRHTEEATTLKRLEIEYDLFSVSP